jgi:8-oxo-dGTP pyrophosphatase MutT (NUDIX family)
MSDRPTFEHRGRPVRAAGVLLWTKHDGHVHRLFRKVNGKFEDIGGKTDPADTSAVATAVRETVEETGGKLFSEFHTRERCGEILHRLLEQTTTVEYNQRSKYLLFKLKVEPSILEVSMKRFGLSEETDWGTLQHYYQWRWQLPYQNQLHFRLRGLRL